MRIDLPDDYNKKINGFLDFIGLSIEEIVKMRRDILVNGKLPKKIIIPKCKFLGCEVQFGDVAKVKME